MSYTIKNAISKTRVPAWGNQKKYIAVHYLGVVGQNHDLEPGGYGAHFYIYWDGTIYQRCSLDAVVWAVGTGGMYTQKHPEARNANTISIEMCCKCDGNSASAEDKRWYFTKETQEACVWLVQKLMKENGIPADHVLRHYDIVNKTCPAPYVHNNKYKTSWTWDEFKNRLNGANTKPESASGTQTVEFANLSEPEAAAKLLEISRPIAEKYSLFPSVCAAQTILESGYGYGTELARIANNVCGMKAILSGNTWPGSVWDGSSTVRIKTPEQDAAGNTYYIYADFRKYPNVEASIEDRCAYLLGAQNGSKLRYGGIQDCKNYQEQIKLIKAGGYATDTKYADKICNIIQRFDLNKYDMAGEGSSPAPVEMKYFVRKSWADKNSQLDAYTDLGNAKKRVDGAWQYNVYDAAGKELYNGVAALNDRIINTAVGIANDNSHGYNNSGKGWGPEYNCIGLVMQSCNMSGINVGKCTIQKMPDYLIKAGYEDVTADINFKNGKGLKKGDILWMLDKTGKHGHTELAVGDGRLVGARNDDDGCPGDGTGREIAVSAYYNYSWQRVFRLPGAGKTQGNVNQDTVFRVQAGAYKDNTKAIKVQKRVRNAGYPDAFIRNEDGMYKIQAWAGRSRDNAEKVVKDLKKKGINSFVK